MEIIKEAPFDKNITNISSLEEFNKVLNQCNKNNIRVTFEMPFMTKEDLKNLNSDPSLTVPGSWRYSQGFNYQDYYKDNDIGDFKRIDAKKYVVIEPRSKNLVTDNKLTIQELYTELARSPEDFEMFIEGNKIDFGVESKSLKKDVHNIPSLESFVKVIKKCIANKVVAEFEMPFARKEYRDDIKNLDSYTRSRKLLDPKFREKYEEIGQGTLSYINQNKYVYIAPNNRDLIGDMRLTFSDLYNNLLHSPDDYRMSIDGREITFNETNESINSNINKGTVMRKNKQVRLSEDDNQSPIDVARRMGYDAAKSGDRSKFDASLRSLMNNHPGDKQRRDIHSAYISGMDDYKNEQHINEDDNQSPIDVARRMGYDAAREGDKDKYDSSLRSLMNDHPGDKQRHDIHAAFMAGMEDFKDGKNIKEDMNDIKSLTAPYRKKIENIIQSSNNGSIDPKLKQKAIIYLEAIKDVCIENDGEEFWNNYSYGILGNLGLSHDDLDESADKGKDLGKPGKNFTKIAKAAGKEYGSKKAGDKVAGAVLAKLRAKHPEKYSESDDSAETGEKTLPAEDNFKSDGASVDKKFVIELSFPTDGDTTLADCIEKELGKSAEVNEVLRTRRIMEFDFRNSDMFNAAIKTIHGVMKAKGKKDYKLDSREDDDSAPEMETDNVDQLKEEYGIYLENNRSPMMVTLPFIVESLKWASRSGANESSILKFANGLASNYNSGSCLDI